MCLGIKGIFSNDANQTSSRQGECARKGTAKETSKQSNFQKSKVREEIAKEDVGCYCSHDHNATEET